MQDIANWFNSLSNTTIGFWTSVIIFLITLFLVSRQLIGFSITLLLLLFTLAVGVTISSQEWIRNYYQTKSQAQTGSSADLEAYQKQVQNSFDSFKTDFDSQMQKVNDQLEKIYEKIQSPSVEKKEKE